jgi:predicted acylesterase/phospholipase RssA
VISSNQPADEKVDILVLSGGGSHGEWGAGVLRGWSENPVYPRPKKFPVVTGVSTGALLATYAFLGEKADDDLLEEAYTTAKTSDIYKKKCLLLALFSDSLYNSKPLAKRISKYITSNTLDRVAMAGQKVVDFMSAPPATTREVL